MECNFDNCRPNNECCDENWTVVLVPSPGGQVYPTMVAGLRVFSLINICIFVRNIGSWHSKTNADAAPNYHKEFVRSSDRAHYNTMISLDLFSHGDEVTICVIHECSSCS